MLISPLTDRREELNLSLQQVADRAGLSLRTLYRLEAVTRLPQSASGVKAYARALRLSEADLRALVAHGRTAALVADRSSSSCTEPTHVPARRPGQVAK